MAVMEVGLECGLDLSGSGQGPVARCAHGNETSRFIKRGISLPAELLSACQEGLRCMVLVVSRTLHFSLRLIVWVSQSDGTNST
jgi:hypothetical protein